MDVAVASFEGRMSGSRALLAGLFRIDIAFAKAASASENDAVFVLLRVPERALVLVYTSTVVPAIERTNSTPIAINRAKPSSRLSSRRKLMGVGRRPGRAFLACAASRRHASPGRGTSPIQLRVVFRNTTSALSSQLEPEPGG